jgi:DNA repair exonuclease SbcCD ATPase subunit
MRLPFAAIVVTLAVVLASAPASAQSLGEVAAREKARKEKAARDGKRPARVITEYELRSGGGAGTLSQPAADEAAASAGTTGAGAPPARAGAAEKTEDELRAERLQDWRQRLQEAQADVARLRARVDQVQSSLNDMSGPIYGPNRGVMANQLEQAKTALTAAEQKVAAIEEEGRRNRYR